MKEKMGTKPESLSYNQALPDLMYTYDDERSKSLKDVLLQMEVTFPRCLEWINVVTPGAGHTTGALFLRPLC